MYLIDRGELLMQMMHKFHYELPDGCNNPLYGDVIKVIEDAPLIEAEPVRHGRWVIEKRHEVSRNPYIDDNYFASATCSECDFCIHAETKSFGYPDLNTTNYCPNCGAKMDGGADNEP